MNTRKLLAISTAALLIASTPALAQLGVGTGGNSSGSASGSTGGAVSNGPAGSNINNTLGVDSDIGSRDGSLSGSDRAFGEANRNTTTAPSSTPSTTGRTAVPSTTGRTTGTARTSPDRADFGALDTDRNNSISEQEFRATGRADAGVFSNLDVDNNGVLSQTELNAYGGVSTNNTTTGNTTTGIGSNTTANTGVGSNTITNRSFSSLDLDRNNSLTEEEFRAGGTVDAGVFSGIDTNRDGVLSQAELNGYNDAQARPRLSPNFATLDLDNNSRLSPAEFSKAGITDAGAFAALDVNNNGYLSRSELNAYQGGQIQPRITGYGWLDHNELDRNRNGKLTVNEFTSTDVEEAFFRRLDTNGDGRLSQPELNASTDPAMRTAMGTWLNMNALDADNNNSVTLREFTATPRRSAALFNALDLDKDKTLSPEELNAYAR